MTWIFLTLAIILMSTAHFIRVLRWELFVKVYEKPDRKRLLKALSLGYLINYFVPYKLGDIVKGFFAGNRMKNGKALGFSTVIVDRYLDVLSVGLIFILLTVFGSDGSSIRGTARFYIIFFVVLLAVTFLIYALRGILKKAVRSVASIFNTRIETSLLQFFWALIWNFKDIFLKINKVKLLLYTVGMWVLYIGSYELFGRFMTLLGTETGWTDMFLMLFGENGVTASTVMLSLISHNAEKGQVFLLAYMICPLVILTILSFILKKKDLSGEDSENYLNLIPQLNQEEKLAFLDRYFSNINRDYINNYLKINQNVSIVRDYSAGSNATTMLCVDTSGTFFRKYAFGGDGVKLSEQLKWIEENTGKLPLPEILRQESNEFYCYYDMPFNGNAVGMFEYMHSMPAAAGFKIIENVLNTLEGSIYQTDVRAADEESIRSYISKKVTDNLVKIKESHRLKNLYSYPTVLINGREYRNLSFFEKMLSADTLTGVFKKDVYSVIHGDLTIENIVCTRGEGPDDFYLIDPNTGNIHNSPNLDYAKLLQSLHGGYEFLMMVTNVNVNDNRIDFLFTKSESYTEIYRLFTDYMKKNFDEDRVMSIFMHEAVHWLRLMPYKINKDSRTAPVFYAGLIMVLNDIYDMFGDRL